MHVSLLTVGRARPDWIRDASRVYLSRLNRLLPTTVREVKKSSLPNPSKAVEQEGKRLLSGLARETTLLAMDEKGAYLNSMEFSKLLNELLQNGKPIVFVIGGAFGLSREVLDRATKIISLSKLTFPHQLARIVLLEQIYRGMTIVRGLPYHHV
ncbi:MAG: 23S rRNA (pseudouridine(1915)-N(3))-methyltransferase RlmH [Deltaproteobacteria bacterium]|nr:23S rRNA (pseudouridine(1915)-N(3))-methyltransferase RlmH [Deltaproteobacteria bacterium]